MSATSLEQQIAELMGIMEGSMIEFQRSMDTLTNTQKNHIKDTHEDISKIVAAVKDVHTSAQSMQEAQKKALEHLTKRWSDGMLEKAQEAGHAQARIFGKAVAQEAVQSIQNDLAVADQRLQAGAATLKGISRHLTWQWIGASATVILLMLGVFIGVVMVYLPSPSEITQLREQKEDLEDTLRDYLEKDTKGKQSLWNYCGAKKKLCVRVDAHQMYGNNYMILHTGK
jgi:hypothetical protein